MATKNNKIMNLSSKSMTSHLEPGYSAQKIVASEEAHLSDSDSKDDLVVNEPLSETARPSKSIEASSAQKFQFSKHVRAMTFR